MVGLKSLKEKPKLCVSCPFSRPWDNATLYCYFYPMNSSIEYSDDAPDWCPLVEINESISIEGAENE